MVYLTIFLGLGILTGLVMIYQAFFEKKEQDFAILSEQVVRKSVNLDPDGEYDLDADVSVSHRRGAANAPEEPRYVVIPIHTEAKSRLPIRLYEGESDLIVLHPQLTQWDEDNSLLVVRLAEKLDDKKMRRLERSRSELENYAALQLADHNLGKNKYKPEISYLAIEVMAAGFEIVGETKQRQTLRNSSMTYTWGITAKSSGNHKIAFNIMMEDKSGERLALLGNVIHHIKVVSFLGLTQRQVKLLLGSIGTVTTILTILQALQQLRLFP